MPRPIIGTTPQTSTPSLSPAPVTRQRPAKVNAKPSLRPRSKRYMAALTRLDAGHLHGQVDMDALMEEIAAEFAPAGWSVPIGLLSRCYLGEPFEVHICDLTGGIVEHFHRGAPTPMPYEMARRLATHPSYAAIEIYPDRFVCLREDGSATEVRN